jgi:hypothetical protein
VGSAVAVPEAGRFLLVLTQRWRLQKGGLDARNVASYDSRIRRGDRQFSFTQLVDTSLVSGHLVDSTRCVLIDICSCAEYSTGTAEAFTRKYFRAAQSKSYVVDRHGGRLNEERP